MRLKPRPKEESVSKARRRLEWGIGLGILSVLATLGAWRWPALFSGPSLPDLYQVRVQILDPDGRPTRGATVHASAGNEPHLLLDEWWEIQIPRVKVPHDGRISLWAEHTDWEGNQVDLRLGVDPNPSVKIRLKEPESWIRGRVGDGHDRGLAGARISRQDGAPGVAITDAGGRFELRLHVPRETRVRLRADLAGFVPGDEFCYAGADNCSFAMEKR